MPSEFYRSQFNEVLKEIRKAERKGLAAVGKYARTKAREAAPVADVSDVLPKGQKPGDLKKSIGYVVNGKKNSLKIGSTLKRAIYTEKGTAHSLAFAFITPSVENNQAEIQRIFSETTKAAMPND